MSADLRPDPRLVEDVSRRVSWLGWLTNGAGVLVACISVVFLIPIFLDADERGEIALLNAPLVVAFFVAAGIAIEKHFDRYLPGTVGWIAEGREPSEREHRRALALAAHEVKVSGVGWMACGVVFTLINGIAYSWALAAVIAAASWAAAETTCALIYLGSERMLRPVTARALAVRPVTATGAPSVRARLMGAWALGTGVPLIGVLVVAVVGMTKSDVDSEYVNAAVIFLGALATVIGPLAGHFAAKAIADPLTSVREGLERIERGELDAQVAVDDGSEVGQLQAGFNRMAEGLRERARLRDLFGKQVGEDVARAALRDGTKLGGEEREIGALFVDLVGSTSMAVSMPPTEVVRVLNRFFRVVIEVVEAEGGLVNKFEGDAALCVFGAPVPSDDPACDALRCARELAARLTNDVPEVDFGIGISAGLGVAGNVGAESRFEYTVIGDPVNEAARLAELAKERPERVLASDAALDRAAASESDAWRLTDSAMLRGRNSPTGLAHPRLS